ncbi:MAG: NADH-quinone oxidoreductase subunit NuoB [Fibrobacter sp.]|nr:NADH-quinone oxidoreductase subunit NuoB [Fibrobacter sp.]
MLKTLFTRLKQGYRTAKYPLAPPVLPDLFKGLPEIDSSRCGLDCRICVEGCALKAIERTDEQTKIDIGKCTFCGSCEKLCPLNAIHFTKQHSMAASKRENLITGHKPFSGAAKLDPRRLSMFKRSIRLRQVSAGGCNACEADVNVLNTLVFDLSRFGIQFVASPRHADGLLITGPVSKNMELALKKTYDATPSPKIVIAVGSCAISGGMFAGHDEVNKGVSEILPVDLFIPGCPPHPYTILDGILKCTGRI